MQLKPHSALTAIFLACVFCVGASAQDAGIFNSLKGIGASVRFPERNGVFHSATAFVDIYGIATSRCSYPGYKANFSRQYSLKTWKLDDYSIKMYAGPGLSVGYVRDHDKGRGIDLVSLISDNEGMMFAASGDIGWMFDFGGLVSLDLSFTADAGVHVRRNEKERGYWSPSLSIYNNGLMQAFYPQLTIWFRFR